jgi:hypothetical protein
MNPIILLFLVIAAFLIHPEEPFAQKYPLELSTSQTGMADLKGHNGAMSVKNDHASLVIPLLPFESFSLLFYLKEDEKTFTYDDAFTEFTLQENNQTYQVEDLPEKLVLSCRGVMLFLVLGESGLLLRRDQVVASDYEEVNEEDQGFMNQVMLFLDREKDSRWSFGAAHIGGIAADSIWPLIGYKYKSDTFILDIVFPSYGYLFVRLGDLFYVIAEEVVESDNYRLAEEDPWNNGIYSTLNLTSRLELGITPFADLEIGISYGLNLFREIMISDQDDNELGNLNLKDTSVWGVNLQWRI